MPDAAINGYTASVLSDFLRHSLLSAGETFTFETVMSHESKVAFLRQARAAGYRTYLYYVATEDPEINVSRVRNRVAEGGHNVPVNKIISRYADSLKLLLAAIGETDRAYLFDNSGEESFLIAEITDGQDMEIMVEEVPAWFKTYVLDKSNA